MSSPERKPDATRGTGLAGEDLAEALDVLFSDSGPLAEARIARRLSYRHRPEQLKLALKAARAQTEKGVLLADAPTGTGKSLGYLAPAVLSGRKAVISTATIALQTQLLTEDLPVLKDAVCRLMGYPQDEGFTSAVMKGRANFICGTRYEDTLREGSLFSGSIGGFSGDPRDLLSELDLWRATTETGDREDLHFAVPAPTWREIASDGEDCAPKSCRFRDGCHYYAHREKASEADLIVVNHALLLANAAAFGAIFETGGKNLVIDEAHRIEEIMADAFGARVSFGRARYVARQATKKSVGASRPAGRAEGAAELFFDELRTNTTLGNGRGAPRSYGTLVKALHSVYEALESDPKQEANNLTGMVARLLGDLRSFYSEHEESHAYAVIAPPGRSGGGGSNRKPYPELKSWLIETADTFRDGVLSLFEDGGAILASATLAEGGDPPRSFSYVRRRLGLAEPGDTGDATDGAVRLAREHSAPEAFDYAGRTLIYLEDGIEGPARPVGTGKGSARGFDGHLAACVRRAEELVTYSGGKALILLTTGRAVRAFRESFHVPYPVRYQGEDSPSRLVRWLKGSKDGVLVGTRGLWEGVDIPGPAVSLVIIDRVPFAPPDDPVQEALVRKAGKDWFGKVSLPKARVAMRQGAGRLMRSATDRGVIAILDPRVKRKSWGKAVLRSLPPAPTTSSPDEVRHFFEGTTPTT